MSCPQAGSGPALLGKVAPSGEDGLLEKEVAVTLGPPSAEQVGVTARSTQRMTAAPPQRDIGRRGVGIVSKCLWTTETQPVAPQPSHLGI